MLKLLLIGVVLLVAAIPAAAQETLIPEGPVAVSPDGRLLAVGSRSTSEIILYDRETQQAIRSLVLEGHWATDDFMRSLTWTPDFLIAESDMHFVDLIDPVTFDVLQSAFLLGLNDIACSPVDTRCVFGGATFLMGIDMKEPNALQLLQNPPVEALDTLFWRHQEGLAMAAEFSSWSPDGSMIATEYPFGTQVDVWDSTTGARLAELGTGEYALEPGWRTTVHWSPDSKTLVLSSMPPLDQEQIPFLQMYDFEHGDLLDLPLDGEVWGGGWSLDGQQFALISPEMVYLWDVASNEMTGSFEHANGNRVLWREDGRYLAVGGGTLSIRDAMTLEEVTQLAEHPNGYYIHQWVQDEVLVTAMGKDSSGLMFVPVES